MIKPLASALSEAGREVEEEDGGSDRTLYFVSLFEMNCPCTMNIS
jgi:hypothetical protein